MEEKFNLPQKSIYGCSFDTNLDNFDNIAIEYVGNRISYLDLFVKVEEVSKSLLKMGIKNGDVVSICLPPIPEAFYIFLALNKIGATLNIIDPSIDTDKIETKLNDTNSKMIIYLDVLYAKLVNIFNTLDIDNIVSIPLSNSFHPIVKAICDLKDSIENIGKSKAICDREIINWDSFIKKGIDYKEEPIKIEDEINNPCVIIYEDGKRIDLTNYDLLLKVYQNRVSNMKWLKKDTFLGIMSLSNIESYVLSLCNGLKIDLEPTAMINKLDEYVLRYKPNHILCNKLFLNSFIKSKRINNRDLSFIKTFILSDTVPPLNEELINLLLLKHHSEARVSNDFAIEPLNQEKLNDPKI